MDIFIESPFTFIFTIFNAIVSLGNVLWEGLTYSITVPAFITDLFNIAPFELSLFGLLGGTGIIFIIIWRLVK
jgi:hypothetical protein